MDMFLAVAIPLLVQGLAGEISKIKSQLGGVMARLTCWRKKDVFIRRIAYEKVKGRDVASSRFASSLEKCFPFPGLLFFHILVTELLVVCVAHVEWQS